MDLRRISAALASTLTIALLAAPWASADHTASSVRYVAGGSANVPGLVGLGAAVCQGPPSDIPLPVGAGGACAVALEVGLNRVTVVDDILGPVPFSFAASPEGGPLDCDIGDAVGEVVLLVLEPGDCDHVSVFVHAPATAGLIEARPA